MMRFTVIVKPHAHRTLVEPQPDGTLVVSVTAPATEGQANGAVVDAIAEHLGVAPSRVAITRGGRGRTKIVEVI